MVEVQPLKGRDMSYAWYKFNKAIQSLNEYGMSRREWLASDHVYRLMRLTEEDIPPELRAEFRQFQRDVEPIIRATELESSIDEAMLAIDDDLAKRIVERITYMHDVIELSENMIFSPRDFSAPPNRNKQTA